MGKVITTTLTDLPATFAKTMNSITNPITSVIPKSTDPLVDGSALTTNEDIKHRRKRIIARPKNYRKHAKIREFQALCNWLIGKGSPLEKPTTQHKQILSAVRNNTVIPDAYEPWIRENYDLVSKAACTKPKELDKKWEIYIFNNRKIEDKLIQEVGEQVKTIEKIEKPKRDKIRTHVDNYVQKLRLWSTEGGTATQAACFGIRHYQIHKGKKYSAAYPKSLLIALQENPDLAEKIYSDVFKSRVRPLTEEESKFSFSILYNSGRHPKPQSEETLTVQAPQDTKYSTPDTLTLLIQLAKKAGASEVTIKL